MRDILGKSWDNVLLAEVKEKPDGGLMVRTCPYCGRAHHHHGSGGETGRGVFGHRQAQCHPDNLADRDLCREDVALGYILVTEAWLGEAWRLWGVQGPPGAGYGLVLAAHVVEQWRLREAKR